VAIKTHIRKIFFLAFWIAVGTGIMVLLVAAIRDRNDKTCRGYSVRITGAGEKRFTDEQLIVNMLKVDGAIRGRSLKRFDLKEIEGRLEKNAWIRNAELFFNNNQVLQVRIEEKEPVARIFNTDGNSYYISRNGEYLPLSPQFSAKLPVFTNVPVMPSKMTRSDSVLVLNIEHISDYLAKDAFWSSQIAQIDITPARNFEMLPVIGNHIIEFGDGADCDKKFRRLMLFYQQVLSQAGMDAYARIKVQYAGQIVGVKSAAYNKTHNN
jgi:cell division protein FtsQ